MASPEGILDIVWAEEDPAGELNESVRLNQAAGVVEDFVQENSLAALDALLEATQQGGLEGTEKVLATATEITAQTDMLTNEVRRFLDTTSETRSAS